MKHAYRLTGVTVAAVLLIGATCAFAQDWPQWRGPGRDGKAQFTAPKEWPKEFKQVWMAPVGTGDATPALVGDKLYVIGRRGEEEVTCCLNAADGKEVWKTAYPAKAISGPAAREHSGPRSSPAVAEGKVVTIGVNGEITCLDAASGKEAWRKDVFPGAVPKFFTSSSPIIADGMAIAQLGGPGNGGIIAFDLASGAEKWKWTAEGPDYASPVMMTVDGTKMIVTLTEKSAVGIGAADGKLLWQAPFAPAGRMAYNAATPIVDGQTVIITGSGRGAKALKIEKAGEAFAARELWSKTEIAPQFATPVLKDGNLFNLSDKGMLYCISAKDGAMGWTDTVSRGRGFAAMVDAGPVVMALPSTSELVVLKPDGKKLDTVATIRVAATPTYATPVVSGKRIFVKDQESVALYMVE